MSVSLLRLQDGRIGCVFCIKWSLHRLIPVFSYSEDEGLSWSQPVPVTDRESYFVVNNDRLSQLRDGTLVLPYAEHPRQEQELSGYEKDYQWNARCGLFFSKDGGTTWQLSPHDTTFTPSCFVPPLFKSPLQDQDKLAYHIKNRKGVFQEPGVQELSDGSLMLYMRSTFYIYRCFAKHVEAPWGPCTPIPDLNVCCGPQTIKQLPHSTHLIMLYNDRGTLPWGDPEFNWRTPLSVALSRDDGKTWNRLGTLEDHSKNYCYASLLFFEERFIASYYQSGLSTVPGSKARRNLASLKICTGDSNSSSTVGKNEVLIINDLRK